MTITKKKKRILLSVVFLVALIAVVIGLLVFYPSQEKEDGITFLKEAPENSTGKINYPYVISNGVFDNEIEYPLPFYEFIPPEGYEQYENAEVYANRFSVVYSDSYSGMRNGLEETLTFGQDVARDGFQINNYTNFEPQIIEFGDFTVLYCITDRSTRVYWFYGQSILTLISSQARDPNEMLELINRVDYEANRQPIYSPLQLSRGGSAQGGVVAEFFESSGNPEIPQTMLPYQFPQIPEGFEEISFSQGVDAFTYVYANEQGDHITLKEQAGKGQVFNFDQIQLQSPEIMAQVLDVTVNGNPGYFYQTSVETRLAWTAEYYTMEMIYKGDITQEEMIALAESLVQKEIQTQSEASASS